MTDRRPDKILQNQSTGSDDGATALSQACNPVGQLRETKPASPMDLEKAPVAASKELLLARAEFRTEYAQAVDKKPDRRRLLDDQLKELYPDPARIPRNASEIKRLTDAFEKDYATFAPALDIFENSTRFQGSKAKDLAMRQELMDWTNRAGANGRDNTDPRLTRKQQADLQTAEAVGTPNPAADATIKAKVAQLQKFEQLAALARNNPKGVVIRGYNSNQHKALRNDPEVQTYLAQKPGQPAGVVSNSLDEVLNGQLHHVHHTTQRWAEVTQTCNTFHAQQQKPSTNEDYWKAEAERLALSRVNSPKSLDEALAQEQWRTLLIAREKVGLTSQGTYSLRRFEDNDYDGKDKPNPFDDAAKIPNNVKSVIANKIHDVGNARQTVDRLATLHDECERYKQVINPDGSLLLPNQSPAYWARVIERDALQEFRGTTSQQKQARALMIKAGILGLSAAETKTMRELRDIIQAGKDQ